MLEQANESLAAGLHHKAVELYSNVLTESSDWPEVRYRRAVAYSELGEGQKALDDLGVLLQSNPKNGEALQLRGDLLVEKDRPANAVESYTRAIRAGVKTAAVYLGRAAAYAKLQQYDQAVSDYGEGIRLRLNNPVAHKDRGLAFVALGRLQDAIEDFDRAIALKPDYWEAYVERAHAYGSTGRFELAMPDLNKVLAAQPSDVKALGLRGSALLLNGDAAKAIEDYTKAIELNPRDVQLLMARGSAYTRVGEHRKSLADREAAVRLRPRMSETYVARGGSYHELGEHEKGLADRTEAIRLAPASGLAWAARGNAYFLLARYSEAAADLRKAVDLLPGDKSTQELLEKAEVRSVTGIQVASEGPTPRGPNHVAKVSALTVTSVLDLPRTPDPDPAADVSAVPADRAASAPQVISEQAVFTPSAPVPPAAAVVELPQPKPEKKPVIAAPAPVSADQLNQQGRALLAQRNFQGAIDVLTRAIALKPNFALALNARGFAYYMLKKIEPALADLNKAIQLDPNYVNAYRNRSIVLQQAGQTKAAEDDRQTEQRLLQRR
jgi:tetratricopeptide (TPR) repeat protein